MKSIGIIGFGQFGQFMEKHLSPHFIVRAYDPHVKEAKHTLQEVCESDIVVFAVPMQALEARLHS